MRRFLVLICFLFLGVGYSLLCMHDYYYSKLFIVDPKSVAFFALRKVPEARPFILIFLSTIYWLRVVYCLETSLNLWLLDIDKGWVLNLGSIQQNDDPKSSFRGPGGPCPFGQTFYFNTNNFREGTVKAQNFLPIYFSGPGPRPCVSTGSSMEISK